MTVPSEKLKRLAREYWQARIAQERDHTDEDLEWSRAEMHNLLLLQMDIEGILYRDREDAARIARDWGQS